MTGTSTSIRCLTVDYHDRLTRGLDVSDYRWPAGFPLNGLDAVKSLAKPPNNAKEFDWGAFDKADAEMGDGQMVEWAVKFLAKPPKQPFFLAAGIYRPHLPFYAPRNISRCIRRKASRLPPVKADDLR